MTINPVDVANLFVSRCPTIASQQTLPEPNNRVSRSPAWTKQGTHLINSLFFKVTLTGMSTLFSTSVPNETLTIENCPPKAIQLLPLAVSELLVFGSLSWREGARDVCHMTPKLAVPFFWNCGYCIHYGIGSRCRSSWVFTRLLWPESTQK